MGFHHIAMNVTNFDESIRFYRGALGYNVAKQWGEPGKRAALIDVGGNSYIEIFEQPEQTVTVERGKAHLAHFALHCEDPDAAIERAREYGAKIRMEPQDVDIPSTPVYPVRIAFCLGPDGEEIEFFKER
jgi:glyoxylase I family protein